MTTFLIITGLILAPPTGWLIGAWMAERTYPRNAK